MSDNLTTHELDQWTEQAVAALRAADIPGAIEVSERHQNGCLYRKIAFECPRWVRGQSAALRLFENGTYAWVGPDASVSEIAAKVKSTSRRWVVPPKGGPSMAVILIERNGWEGEAWRFALPIRFEAAVLALEALHKPSAGRDMRTTPFCPRYLATFGSWALDVTYATEEQAIRRAGSSRSGYMRFANYSATAGADLVDLLERAKERDLLHWADGPSYTGRGLKFWKGRVYLTDETDAEVMTVDLGGNQG